MLDARLFFSRILLENLETPDDRCVEMQPPQNVFLSQRRFFSLDVSHNSKLVFLHCAFNYIIDTTELDRWISVAGHYGLIGRQLTYSPGADGRQYPLGTFAPSSVTGLDLSIPGLDSNGASIPFVGSMLALLNAPCSPKVSLLGDGAFRVALGTQSYPGSMSGSDWRSFKGYVKTGNDFELSAFGGSFGGDTCSWSICVAGHESLQIQGTLRGFMEGKLVDGKPVVTSSGVRLCVSRNIQGSFPLYRFGPAVSLDLGVEYGIGLDVSASLGLGSGGKSIYIDGAHLSVLFPSLTFSLYVDVVKALEAGVYGSASHYLDFPSGGFRTGSGRLVGEVGAVVRCFGFSYTYPLLTGTKHWSNATGASSLLSGGDMESEVARVDADSFSLDASVFEAPSPWLGSSSSQLISENTESASYSAGGSRSLDDCVLQEGVFSDARPKLVVTSTGTKVLVWASIVEGRTAGNNIAVVYSTCEADGGWSAPVIIEDDGTADFDPVVAARGDAVLVSWANATVDDFSSSTELSEVAASCETEAVLLNISSGEISSVFHGGSAGANFSQSVAFSQDGSPVVAWISNSNADPINREGANAVCAARLEGGSWVGATCYSGSSCVRDIAVGVLDGKTKVVYTADGESGSGRAEKVILRVCGVDGLSLEEWRVAEDIAGLGFSQVNGSEVVTWREDDTIFEASSSRATSMGSVDGLGRFCFASIQGESYLVYDAAYGSDGTGSALRARSAADGSISSSVSTLAKKDGRISSYAVAEDGERLIVTAAIMDATVADGVVTGSTRLEVWDATNLYDLVLVDAACDASSLAGRNETTLSLTIANDGLRRVKPVVSIGGMPCELGVDSSEAFIDSGEMINLLVPYTVSGEIDGNRMLEISVSPMDESGTSCSDFCIKDNGKSVKLGYADLSISCQSDSEGGVTCVVSNAGRLPSSSVLHAVDSKTGEELASRVVPSVARRSDSARVSFSLDDFRSYGCKNNDVVVFEIEPVDEEDSDLSDNADSGVVRGVMEEIYGASCFDTSAESARRSHPNGFSKAILACEESYCDALSLAGLAGLYDAPVLLTARDELPDAIASVLDDMLLPGGEVIIAGGEGIVSLVVEEAVRDRGFAVRRVFGNARDDTPVAAYRDGNGWGKTAIVTWAGAYYDMLSVGPLAYGSHFPVFLTDGEDRVLSQDAVMCIVGGDFERVVFAGGAAVVPESVRAQLNDAGWNGDVVRLSGNSEYDTNIAIAQWCVEDCGFSYHGLACTVSTDYRDGVGGVALCGSRMTPLLLVNEGEADGLRCFPEALGSSECSSSSLRVSVLGGPSVISANARISMLEAIGWM